MIKITDDSYENFIKSGDKTKILKLGATWCSPCQMAIPPCNELEKELVNDVEIGELDIEESANTPVMLSCKGVPLFVKFKDGKEVSRKVGWPGKQELKDWIINN